MNKIHIISGDYHYLLEDLINACTATFEKMGYTVTMDFNKIHDTAINLNLGSNRISNEEFYKIQDRLIHYNLEQVVSSNYLSTNGVNIERLKIGFVWDYSAQNINQLRTYGIWNTRHVPIGYIEAEPRIISYNEPDIDVLFYGYESPRRIKVLEEIEKLGLNLVTANIRKYNDIPWNNKYRNELIGRSKVVLNIHAYEFYNIFEIIRVSTLLSNKKAVVSEITPNTEIEQYLMPAIVHGSINQLPLLCKLLVDNKEFRNEQADLGYNIFRTRNYIDNIANGLEDFYRIGMYNGQKSI